MSEEKGRPCFFDTQEKVDELLKYFHEGHTRKQCAKHFGCGESTISRTLEKAGVGKRVMPEKYVKRRLDLASPTYDEEKLRLLWYDLTLKELGEVFGVNKSTVGKWGQNLGLKRGKALREKLYHERMIEKYGLDYKKIISEKSNFVKKVKRITTEYGGSDMKNKMNKSDLAFCKDTQKKILEYRKKGYTVSSIAEQLGVAYEAVSFFLRFEIPSGNRHAYTSDAQQKELDDKIISMWPMMSLNNICELLGHPRNFIENRARALGLVNYKERNDFIKATRGSKELLEERLEKSVSAFKKYHTVGVNR